MRLIAALAMIGLFGLSGRMLADTIELTNGDLVSGKVVSLDEKELLLSSELLGEMKIARGKVAVITFGARKPQAVARPAIGEAAPAVRPRPKALAEELDLDGVLNQLKQGGGDLGKLLEKDFPLLNEPEVKGFFDETVSGLISGEMSIEDLRKKAIDVRKQVRELEKELGPEGAAALKPYTGILDKFIREAAPSDEEDTADEPNEDEASP